MTEERSALEGWKRRVNVGELVLEVTADFRELMVKGGSAIAAALFEEEIQRLCGPKYAAYEEIGAVEGDAASAESLAWSSGRSFAPVNMSAEVPL